MRKEPYDAETDVDAESRTNGYSDRRVCRSQVTRAFAATAAVAQTGQTTSLAEGDDEDVQAGVSFPNSRFRDNKTGTVTDKLTGLVWLKDANCFRSQSWADALHVANTPASGSCHLTDGSVPGDWYVPNVNELQSLINFGTFNPALPPGHPFSNVIPASYWSSTTFAAGSDAAWFISLDTGFTGEVNKGNLCGVWPVRGSE
jgi:hypothetical protein